ncbi:MAG: HD domain-containing protein [Clostridiales bacterium]|nr:HD domain-containing protein [Clostridiales bacterium]
MNFTKLPNGMSEGFALVKKCDEKTTKSQSKYLDIILADKSGEIPAKLWDYKGSGMFEVDSIVKVRGCMEQFNGKDQLRITHIRAAVGEDNIDAADFVPASKTKGEDIFLMLRGRVDSFEDSDLKLLVGTILDEKKDILVTCPAAYRLHHAMLGGLMLHTAGIVKMAEKICEIYPNIDCELLISGAILHDVQKTEEYEFSKTGLVSKYSKEGQLLGHIVKGVVYIDETAKRLGIESEKILLLEHMVLSHHGTAEFGSPVQPMFIEAEILSTLDLLDAEIYEFSAAVQKAEPGTFTDRQWALDNRRIYNHALKSNEHVVKLD